MPAPSFSAPMPSPFHYTFRILDCSQVQYVLERLEVTYKY